jgi:hypothetical protein
LNLDFSKLSVEELLERRGQIASGQFNSLKLITSSFPTVDERYAAIKAIDAEIRRRPDCPRFVKVVARRDINVDGQNWSEGEQGELTERQFNALAAHFLKTE